MSDPTAASGRGRFITFEGGEGAGKSTQARRLAARLETAGRRAIVTREPGGSPLAETIRGVILSGKASALGPMGEAILFGAARIDHIDKLIAPALAAGTWVVCDRFADSTRAYQGAAGKASPDLIAELEKVVVREIKPDLTILMDLPPQTGLARARKRAAGAASDRFESEDLAFHNALRDAFLDIAAREPGRVKIVDATETEDAIAEKIWTILRDAFPAELAARDA
ncbi:MAG: dTMP kinase [Hyphomicrobiales bacterium]|nr:dTMP kinase [Hyphomicrobiales bacterium]